jgi:hypothetical protein
MLFIFVVVTGFVTAAIMTNLVSVLVGGKGNVSLSFSSVVTTLFSMLLLMVCGPYLVAGNGIAILRTPGDRPSTLMTMCFCMSLVWSFCLGLLTVQALLLMGWLSGI